jgi:predicted glycosyltransferase
MTREAAVLGTPAYSIFWGSPPAVDLYLEQLGLLRILRHEADIQTIEVDRRPIKPSPTIGQATRDAVLTAIEDFARVYR